jgi:CubicO group peptidase (beta-lactamase class C family)
MFAVLGRLVAAALFIVASAPAAAAADQPDNARLAAMRALLAPWDRTGGPGAQVVITLDGAPAARVAVGGADLEQGRAVTPTTAFHAASLSKQVTAFAVLLLEEDGALSVDDPLARHVPEAAHLGPITLRQLLNHTSGLRDQWTLLGAAGWRNEDLVTDEQALRMVLAQRGGNFAPGTAYQYNNSGYTLLAEVVRRRSGMSLAAFAKKRIFEPLGMTRTRFIDDASVLVPERASSYRRTEAGFAREPLNYATAGPTGLVTTAEDLTRWAANFESRRIGARRALDRMAEQGVLSDGTVNTYAMGQERRPYKGLDTWSHGGRDAGFRSFLLRVPAERFSVAVLSNDADFDSAKIAFAVADVYLKDRSAYRVSPPRRRTTPSAAQLKAYAGDYELFPGLIFSFRVDGRRLLLSVGGGEPSELPATSDRTFVLNPDRDLAIEFPSMTSGKAPRLSYRVGLHGALPAPRVELKPLPANPTPLREFVGRYHSPELATEYTLAVEGDQLVATHPRRPAIPLRLYQPDTFSSGEFFFQRLAFERDGSGRATGFKLSGTNAENVRFVRSVDD